MLWSLSAHVTSQSLLLVGSVLRERLELLPHIQESPNERIAAFGIEVHNPNRGSYHVVVRDTSYQNVALVAPLVSVAAGHAGYLLEIEIQLWQ